MECLLQHSVDEVKASVRDLGYSVVAEELLAGLDLGLCGLSRVIAGAEPDDSLVALEHLDGQEADVVYVLRQGLLDVGEGILDRVAENPLLCREELVLDCVAALLNCLPEALSADGGDLNHRNSELGGELRDVDAVAALLDDIDHVDGDDYRDAELDELGREVEVPVEVCSVNDVEDTVRVSVNEIVSGNHLIAAERGEGVGSGEVDHLNLAFLASLDVEIDNSRLALNSDSRPVAHVLVGTREVVEHCGLAAVGVAGKGNG